MPMRQDCKYFESRTYPNGDTVRKCDLDLAPEAPWRCPENCPKYTRRLADVNWSHGNLITPETPPEPESLGQDDSIAALLDAAEDIINSAGPQVMADLDAERRKRSGGKLRRATRRIPGVGKKDKKDDKDNTDNKKDKSADQGGPPGPGGHRAKKPKGDSWGEKLRRRYRGGY